MAVVTAENGTWNVSNIACEQFWHLSTVLKAWDVSDVHFAQIAEGRSIRHICILASAQSCARYMRKSLVILLVQASMVETYEICFFGESATARTRTRACSHACVHAREHAHSIRRSKSETRTRDPSDSFYPRTKHLECFKQPPSHRNQGLQNAQISPCTYIQRCDAAHFTTNVSHQCLHCTLVRAQTDDNEHRLMLRSIFHLELAKTQGSLAVASP